MEKKEQTAHGKRSVQHETCHFTALPNPLLVPQPSLTFDVGTKARLLESSFMDDHSLVLVLPAGPAECGVPSRDKLGVMLELWLNCRMEQH
eukprot:287028-Pelagomonas_calceolata.AAC.1